MGVLQKIMIGLLFLLLAASFLFDKVGEGLVASGFLLSIAGIILGLMGRPMLVGIMAGQFAVFILEKELNLKE
jgi:hypothetical protein